MVSHSTLLYLALTTFIPAIPTSPFLVHSLHSPLLHHRLHLPFVCRFSPSTLSFFLLFSSFFHPPSLPYLIHKLFLVSFFLSLFFFSCFAFVFLLHTMIPIFCFFFAHLTHPLTPSRENPPALYFIKCLRNQDYTFFTRKLRILDGRHFDLIIHRCTEKNLVRLRVHWK